MKRDDRGHDALNLFFGMVFDLAGVAHDDACGLMIDFEDLGVLVAEGMIGLGEGLTQDFFGAVWGDGKHVAEDPRP